MKILSATLSIILLLPVLAYAEKPPTAGNNNMDNQNFELMAKKMQEMQQCIAAINKKDLAEIEKQSIQFEKKIRELCGKGKRDQAQKEALSFGKKMSKFPAMKAMNKCAKTTMGNMEGMTTPGQDMDFTNRHACDELSGTY